MLVPIQRTSLDLNFRLFRIPVRVHPTYWLVSAFFAFRLAELGVHFWLIGIACLLLSLLVHELGHALMFRYYRMDSAILLYSFGGLAIPEARLPLRSQRIIVTLAGPAANFLLFGIVWGTNYVSPWALESLYTLVIYGILLDVNLYWGLVNLLPVYPLDGGQVSRELFIKYRPGMGVIYSLRLSLIVAIAFSAYAFACHFNLVPSSWTVYGIRPGLFAAILFAILAVNSYQELQNETRRGSFWDDREPWR